MAMLTVLLATVSLLGSPGPSFAGGVRGVAGVTAAGPDPAPPPSGGAPSPSTVVIHPSKSLANESTSHPTRPGEPDPTTSKPSPSKLIPS
ncbi:hypothetical protein ACJA3G_12950, partial [Streptomyces sp. YS-3]